METPLLLGTPTNHARDAARAAGRFGSEMRHRVTDRTSTDLPGLPGMMVTEYVIEVRVLGIDEITLKKRHKQFVLVLSDLERRCVVEILPDRSRKAWNSGWIV